jgi:chaperonin cofactor prefoldin
MNLSQKLQDLKDELKQREAEKDAAHNRMIILRRKIKEFERVMDEAKPFFEEDNVHYNTGNQAVDLAKSDNGHLSV